MKVLITHIIALLFLVVPSSYATTQADDLEKALKALKEKDFNSAKVLIEQIIAKNSFHAGGYYALAVFYSDIDNKPYDYFKAIDYLTLAEKYYSTLTTKELTNLHKLGITLGEMQKLKQVIGQKAVQEAIASKNAAAIDKIITKFASLPDVVAKATEYKYDVAFAEAQHANTYQAYQSFYVRYPNAKQVIEAKSQYEKLWYEHKTVDNTWQAYENFYKNYPDSPYRDKAKAHYEKLYYEQKVMHSSSGNTLENYIKENPASPYTTQAKEQLQSLTALLPIRIADAWGFINGSGQIVIAPTFERVGNFSEGLARFRKNGKWGFMDMKGKEVIPPVYDLVRDFSEGSAPVMQRKRKGLEAFYIDNTGKLLYEKTYPTDGTYWPIHPFQEGLAAVEDSQSKKVGFIDKTGNFAIAPLFTGYKRSTQAIYPFSSFCQGYAWVKSDEGTGLIDIKGVFLIKGAYNQSLVDSLTIPPFYYRSFSDGLCLMEEANSAFYIDTHAKKSITIPVGFTALPFSNGVAWTYSSYDKKFYLIDPQGQTIADLSFYKVYPFREGFAVVQKNQPVRKVYFYDQAPEPTYSFVDKSGKEAFGNIKFDIPKDDVFDNSGFRAGNACIILNGKQTYINREGKVIWQSPERWN